MIRSLIIEYMNQYSHTFTVTCQDMNKDYRLSPAAVLLYFQESYARYMGCLHMAAFDLAKERRMWIITEMEAEMMPVDTFWGDDIVVTIWVSEITPLRVYADYQVTNADTGVMIAKGTSCWNLMNADTRKLDSTDEVAPKIPIRPEMMTATHRKVRFPKEGTVLKQITHKVNQLDLDFNGHVNNRSYVSIAMLTVPDEFLTTHRTNRFIIHWLRESYLGENLTCTLRQIDASTYVHLITKENGETAAEIFSVWEPLTSTVDVAAVARRR